MALADAPSTPPAASAATATTPEPAPILTTPGANANTTPQALDPTTPGVDESAPTESRRRAARARRIEDAARTLPRQRDRISTRRGIEQRHFDDPFGLVDRCAERDQRMRDADLGAQALDLVAEHRPDVLLTDIEMPHLTGLEVAAEITRRQLPTRVIIRPPEPKEVSSVPFGR